MSLGSTRPHYINNGYWGSFPCEKKDGTQSAAASRFIFTLFIHFVMSNYSEGHLYLYIFLNTVLERPGRGSREAVFLLLVYME